MKILITGSTGFIGSNILKSFIGENQFKIETISFNNQIDQRKIVSSEHHMFNLEHVDLTHFLRAKNLIYLYTQLGVDYQTKVKNLMQRIYICHRYCSKSLQMRVGKLSLG